MGKKRIKKPVLVTIVSIVLLILVLSLVALAINYFNNSVVVGSDYSTFSGFEGEDDLEMLKSLPYAQAVAVYEEDLDKVGVIYSDIEKMSDDYIYYGGKLIDRNGSIVHSWPYIYAGIILNDSTYVAQFEFEAEKWGRFHFNGTPMWIIDERIHHDITFSPWGTLFVLSMQVVEYNGRKVEFDVIKEYSLDGEYLGNFSLWENFETFHAFHPPTQLDKPAGMELPENHEMNESNWGGDYQYYHMNNLEFVPENDMAGVHPAFNEGNWILTFRHGHLVFIIDKDTKEVLWYFGISAIEGPHAGQMLPSGNVMIFDNGRLRNWSRVIEVNPVDLSIEFEYKADDFYTLSQGWAEKTSNGNYLITETEKGRVFEITPEKEIVWEYWHPEIVEGNRTTVYRARPYDKEFIDGFI